MTRRGLTRAQTFRLLVAVQALLLVGMVALQERTLARGTIVRLEVRPVDPTDLARGSYVDLQYEIAQTSTRGLDVGEGDEVVVGLRPSSNGLYEATRAYAGPNDVPEGELFIRAYAGSAGHVVFPEISTFYASAQRAQRAERELADGAVARVSLDEHGRPRLCGIVGVESALDGTCGFQARGDEL